MKKLAIAAAALAVLLMVAALPYFFGLKTEQVFRARLAEATTKGQVVFDVLDYKRGYLDSKVTVLITLDFLGEVADTDPETRKLTRFLFQGTVHHGPITAGAGEFNGEPAPALALGAMDGALFFEQEPVFYQMFFGQQPLLASRAVIGPTGEARIRIKGQRLTYDAPDKSLSIDWKGFVVGALIDGDRLTGRVDGDGLTVAAQIGEFKLLGYRNLFDFTRHPTGYYLGRQSMAMDGVNVDVNGQNIFNAGKLSVEYDSAAEGSLMNFTSNVDFTKFLVASRTFGPMKLKTVGRNIDLVGVKMLEQSYRDALVNFEAGRKASSDIAPQPGFDPALNPDRGDDSSGGIELSDDIIAALKTITSGAPSIEVPEFSLESPDGKVTGNVKMGVLAAAKIDFANPESIESAIFMDFALSIPRKLAVEFMKINASQDLRRNLTLADAARIAAEDDMEKYLVEIAERKLDQKIRQGYYKVKGNDLQLSGGLKNGILTINGKRIPL